MPACISHIIYLSHVHRRNCSVAICMCGSRATLKWHPVRDALKSWEIPDSQIRVHQNITITKIVMNSKTVEYTTRTLTLLRSFYWKIIKNVRPYSLFNVNSTSEKSKMKWIKSRRLRANRNSATDRSFIQCRGISACLSVCVSSFVRWKRGCATATFR